VADEGRVGISTDAAPQALRPDVVSGRRRLPLAWLGTVPFFAYAVAFLFVPAGAVLLGAFQDKNDNPTLANVRLLFDHPYIDAYKTSFEISIVTAVIGGIAGLFIAYAAIREGTPAWVRSVLTTFSGVAANFGGIPLAFAFIASLGPLGIVTVFLKNHLHFDLYGHNFAIYSKLGVEITYMYFQLPLMILVIAPAIDGLRKEWREAAANLGAKQWQFWRYVGLPVLMPSILGAMILLFGNAFAAYATAYSLSSGSVNIVPILIGAYYSGNVLDNPHLAQAMAFGMFAVLALMMIVYIPLQRRAARWAK
jgi:putative spermidine/putrescine transport system permease protein